MVGPAAAAFERNTRASNAGASASSCRSVRRGERRGRSSVIWKPRDGVGPVSSVPRRGHATPPAAWEWSGPPRPIRLKGAPRRRPLLHQAHPPRERSTTGLEPVHVYAGAHERSALIPPVPDRTALAGVLHAA